jgi:hypothetical protein
VEAGKGGKIAFLWEGNDPGVDDKLTYKELLERVCQVPTYPCMIASCIMFELVDSAETYTDQSILQRRVCIELLRCILLHY